MKFRVNLVKTVDDSYDIEIGSNLLNNLKEYLIEILQQQKRNIAIITDSNVHTIYGKNFENIVKEAARQAAEGENSIKVNTIVFPAGEKSKTRKIKEYIEDNPTL